MGDEMKKVCLLVLLSVTVLFAQQNNKGNISLVFNGEKIDLPINTVSINKLNNITLSISAVQKDLQMHKKVALKLKLKELSANPDAEILEGTKIEIATIDTTNSGNILSVQFGSETDSGFAHYIVLNRGNESVWEINSVSLRIKITDVKYINGVLHLTGEYSGLFKSKDAPEGQSAEIKDGKFEIII